MTDLFKYTDYKRFLNAKLDELDDGKRGSRARLSRSVGCQTAYTAQVLRGNAHFNLEHAQPINDFLGHTEDQGNYFLLLIQLAKAEYPRLRARFQKQIAELQEGRSLLKNRLEIKQSLEDREQFEYYSSWIFGAVHALTSVPGFQSPSRIASELGISVQQASEVIEFLIRASLLERTEKGGLRIGKGRIHLGVDSPMIRKHHLNWRLKAMQAIERDPRAGLHYSSVISISKSDEDRIRDLLVDSLRKAKTIIRDSHEESVSSLSVDFFRLV